MKRNLKCPVSPLLARSRPIRASAAENSHFGIFRHRVAKNQDGCIVDSGHSADFQSGVVSEPRTVQFMGEWRSSNRKARDIHISRQSFRCDFRRVISTLRCGDLGARSTVQKAPSECPVSPFTRRLQCLNVHIAPEA
jgi:hypothetical protein